MQQTLWPLCDAQLAGLTYLQDIPRHRMDEAWMKLAKLVLRWSVARIIGHMQ